MRNIFLATLLFILFHFTSYSQCIRYNINDNSVGIQTPHEWNVYGHCEFRLFELPFTDINVNAYHLQAGYAWFNNTRGSIRSAINFTHWFLIPNTDKTHYHYWGITPIALTVYPFNREYLGVDLYTTFDPYNATVDAGITLVVRIK